MKWSKWLNDNWQENNILPPELEPQSKKYKKELKSKLKGDNK